MVWGVENDRPFQNRGWCCSEFAIARYANRIVNLTDAAVQAVLESRDWPSGDTVESGKMYADMMRLTHDQAEDGQDGLTYNQTLGVSFTSKGDRTAVRYNFFKMTMQASDIGLD
ncbi:unnamed protein product [Prorocentrum cordatum]|uniref:Phospholipase B-like n=1 Tax=Prorocentrum cordatum TaxID=2364126 RepID=A0ABN9XXD9_9DINO|nr:unnamed protein product [Polarella glacialis]